MEETLIVTSERVDDIPVLVAHMARMGLQRLVDEQFRVHGNWQGLSLGWVTVLWLSHILSEADHRLNHVQLWAEKRLETLCGCSGQTVRALDLSDDRLARVLSALGHDTCWAAFESALNGHLLRVYDLNPQRVRVDSTTVSGRWEVTPDGLFQFGRSKDHRPDLPQVKVMLSSLDPLGMPVATQVVSGEKADDPLYGPAITQVRQGLGRRGLLYVGDCKMGALSTRAFIQEGGDYYLCPLGRRQLSAEVLSTYLVPVWAGEQALVPVYRQGQEGEEEQLAEGYERLETLSAEVEGKTIRWDERRLVLKSLQQARIEQDSLAIRLGRAETDLAALNARANATGGPLGRAPLCVRLRKASSNAMMWPVCCNWIMWKCRRSIRYKPLAGNAPPCVATRRHTSGWHAMSRPSPPKPVPWAGASMSPINPPNNSPCPRQCLRIATNSPSNTTLGA